MTESENKESRKWLDDAEEALNRASDALRAAWEETREARMSTLEAAKEAANRLGRAIDHGIETARETWDPAEREVAPPEEAGAAAEEEE